VHRFIRAEKANHRVSVLCRVLEVSRSGFYAFERRAPCQRTREDERITELIRELHERSRGTYGAPRMRAALRRRGVSVSQKRVARLMRKAGVSGLVKRRRGKCRASRPHPTWLPDRASPPRSARR
jgi:putative transposase